jgi:hypothetical protein
MGPPIRSCRIAEVRQSLAAVFSPAFQTSSPVGLAEINAVRIQLRLRYLPPLCGANTRAALTTLLSCSTRSKEKAISGPGGHPSRRNGWLGHIVAALTRQDRCGHFFGSILFRKNSQGAANRCYTVSNKLLPLLSATGGESPALDRRTPRRFSIDALSPRHSSRRREVPICWHLGTNRV